MSVPWLKRLSGRAEVKYFPPTNGPVMLLAPNRAGVPIYGQPQPTVAFMPPPVAITPLPPPPPRPRPPVPPLTVFSNTEQECTNTCPDGTTGDPITIVIAAGTYTSGVSQAEANAAALAAACAQADQLRMSDPCEEINPPSIAQECQNKVGNCTGVTYTLDGVPFDGIEICGTAVGCPDAFGNYARACGSADVAGVSIVDGYPVFTFNNFQWVNTNQIFSLGCGISGSNPAKGPGSITAVNVTNTESTDISATVNDLTMTANPADNPYTASLTIIFSLVGTEVQALPTQEIDLSLIQVNYCWSAVEDDDEIPWVDTDCEDDTAFVEQDGEDFDYSIMRTRFVIGADEPLTIGVNYRLTVVYSRRAVGTVDPFVVIAEDTVVDFEAEATAETTDWFTVPNEVGYETKVDSYTLEVI